MSDLKNAIVKSVSDVSDYSAVDDEFADCDSATAIRGTSPVTSTICRPKLFPAVKSFNTSLDHITEEESESA